MAEQIENISEAAVKRFGEPFARALATFVKALAEEDSVRSIGPAANSSHPSAAAGFLVEEVPAGENPMAHARLERVHVQNQRLLNQGKLRSVEFDPAKPAKAVGGRLKQLLKERGIKQTQIARRMGVAPSVVSRVLKHPEKSRLQTIRGIAEAAGIPLNELI